jgi:hypothetical protein
MKLVVDEWLWADAGGDNGEQRQKESLRFLEAVFERCDKIVIPGGETEFVRKFYDLCSRADRDLRLRRIVKFFAQKFVQNSDKGEILVPPADVPAQAELETNIKPDDLYLILAFWQSGADLLITTDLPLIRGLPALGIPVVHRDGFLREYLCGK